MVDIRGYKALTDDQKAEINALKEQEFQILTHLRKLFEVDEIDRRWLADARKAIEKGFMYAVRSIAKPETVEFP